jgi:hypothetical protein
MVTVWRLLSTLTARLMACRWWRSTRHYAICLGLSASARYAASRSPGNPSVTFQPDELKLFQAAFDAIWADTPTSFKAPGVDRMGPITPTCSGHDRH